MPKVTIIYDSVSGNTEKVAHAIAEGARSVQGVQVESYKLGTPFAMSVLNDSDAIVLGSPSEYGNVTGGMGRFLESMAELTAAKRLRLKGKVGFAFGSYAWDGGWVFETLGLRMKKLGLKVFPILSIVDQMGTMGTNIDEASLQKCREFGKEISSKILKR